jgi:hypothetical protein
MKLNGWSVVKTPLGVSLRPIDGHGEICVRQEAGFYYISVHQDISKESTEEAVSETRVPIKLLTAKE